MKKMGIPPAFGNKRGGVLFVPVRGATTVYRLCEPQKKTFWCLSLSAPRTRIVGTLDRFFSSHAWERGDLGHERVRIDSNAPLFDNKEPRG